jgi:integrase
VTAAFAAGAAAAFMVATSAEWGAVVRAERRDIDLRVGTVLVRGTKRQTRWRTVSLVSTLPRSLIEYALEHAAVDRTTASSRSLFAGSAYRF